MYVLSDRFRQDHILHSFRPILVRQTAGADLIWLKVAVALSERTHSKIVVECFTLVTA